MISKALAFLTNFLNQELRLNSGVDEDLVIAGSLINPDGSIAENVENKIVVSVLNIEHETFMKSPSAHKTDGGNPLGKLTPPINLNLYLMVSTNFNSYLNGLKILSSVLTSLQANPYFTKQEHPTMQQPLTKLSLEIYNMPFTELIHIWSGIGAKYVPSIVYKMRMMTIQEEKIKKEIPAITGLGNKTNLK
ncbi:uncharacterized protein DUF4255 [Ulvibacter sp. MAR_2010_11]|uniref:DUF4255 domain-containing protein n=1 Tax=Ulvibacter sp. MAR_2010_11 TaxID=1250229 RepID=UPI000C2BC913|nr:DUF4255 domain-containing protein [Ulvibacter sp. MAR_2010_11]PKA83074.1 uncharacterized protein DUF4255 [Ulvibacter sp. MAR_2010_11]